MTSAITPTQAAIPAEPVWRLSVDQYHDMLRASVLTDGDPIELLEGWLIAKMTKNPTHNTIVVIARDRLAASLPEGRHTREEKSITTGDSEPEPDVVVVRGNARDYLQRHPTPPDIALVVEVADTSLQRDQTVKKRIYARAGIAVYWIINLINMRIEVYTEPVSDAEPPAYRQEQHYTATDVIPVIIEGHEIARLSVALSLHAFYILDWSHCTAISPKL